MISRFAMVLLLLLPPLVSAFEGDPDLSLGPDGLRALPVLVDGQPAQPKIEQVLPLADGLLLIGSVAVPGDDLSFLMRLDGNGVPVASFGNQGVMIGPLLAEYRAARIDPASDLIIVTGHYQFLAHQDVVVCRHRLSTGQLDTRQLDPCYSFNVTGMPESPSVGYNDVVFGFADNAVIAEWQGLEAGIFPDTRRYAVPLTPRGDFSLQYRWDTQSPGPIVHALVADGDWTLLVGLDVSPAGDFDFALQRRRSNAFGARDLNIGTNPNYQTRYGFDLGSSPNRRGDMALTGLVRQGGNQGYVLAGYCQTGDAGETTEIGCMKAFNAFGVPIPGQEAFALLEFAANTQARYTALMQEADGDINAAGIATLTTGESGLFVGHYDINLQINPQWGAPDQLRSANRYLFAGASAASIAWLGELNGQVAFVGTLARDNTPPKVVFGRLQGPTPPSNELFKDGFD